MDGVLAWPADASDSRDSMLVQARRLLSLPDDRRYLSEALALLGAETVTGLMERRVDLIARECLVEMAGSRSGRYNPADYRFLRVINALLPQLPGRLADMVSSPDAETASGSVEGVSAKENRKLVGRFCSAVLDPYYEIYRRDQARVPHVRRIFVVFVKTLYFLPADDLLRFVDSFVSDDRSEFEDFPRRSREHSDNWLSVVCTALKRLPREERRRILTRWNVRRVKLLCASSALASRLCYRYGLARMEPDDRDEISFRKPLSDPPIRVSDLVGLVEEFRAPKRLEPPHFYLDFVSLLREKIFSFASELLTSSSIGPLFKSFVESCLNVSWTSPAELYFDPQLFHCLVEVAARLFHESFAFYRSLEETAVGRGFMAELLKALATVLGFLHAFNNSWNHWLDFVPCPSIVKNETFHSDALQSAVDDLASMKRDALELQLLSLCPALIRDEKRRRTVDVSSKFFDMKKRIEVRRSHALEDYLTVADGMRAIDFGGHWDVRFVGESGQGRGVKREFYCLVAREFQSYELGLWYGKPVTVETDPDGGSENGNEAPVKVYVQSDDEGGLYPMKGGPSERKLLFRFGQLLARVLMDRVVFDVPLGLEFFVTLVDAFPALKKPYVEAARIVPKARPLVERLLCVKRMKATIADDPSLTDEEKRQRVGNLSYSDDCSFEQLAVNFTMPGTDRELVEGGADVVLGPENLELYLDSLGRAVLGGDHDDPVSAVRNGFASVFPLEMASAVGPRVLRDSICGRGFEPWTVEQLLGCFVLADGYDADSVPVRHLAAVLALLGAEEQSRFVQFVTGAPRLPLGGLRGLRPPLTVVRIKSNDGREDLMLPTARTCFNTLCLPEYSSLEVARERILYSINEGLDYFGFV